jgi:hypothetical protein
VVYGLLGERLVARGYLSLDEASRLRDKLTAAVENSRPMVAGDIGVAT